MRHCHGVSSQSFCAWKRRRTSNAHSHSGEERPLSHQMILVLGKKNYLITYLHLQMVSDKLHPGNLELTGARRKPEPREMTSNSKLSACPAEKSYPPVAKPPCSLPLALCYPESIKSSWLHEDGADSTVTGVSLKRPRVVEGKD